MIAAKASRSPARRRPPPCGRMTSVGGTTRRNSAHNSSGTSRSTGSHHARCNERSCHKRRCLNSRIALTGAGSQGPPSITPGPGARRRREARSPRTPATPPTARPRPRRPRRPPRRSSPTTCGGHPGRPRTHDSAGRHRVWDAVGQFGPVSAPSGCGSRGGRRRSKWLVRVWATPKASPHTPDTPAPHSVIPARPVTGTRPDTSVSPPLHAPPAPAEPGRR